MDSYGNDMFLSQEGYPSIDFTLLDRPSTSVASAPESTAALLPDSSFPSFDFLDNSGGDFFGGTHHAAEGSQFVGQGRSEMSKDMDWRKEKTHHPSATNMYIQGGENQEPRSSSPQVGPLVDYFSAKQSCSDNIQAQLSTSGNRVGDEMHDFSELEHLSPQQSQLERRQNWSVLNSNALSSDKRNEESNYVHHSSYDTDKANRAHDNVAFDRPRNNDMVSTGMLSFMPLEAQPSDARHASRMALGARSPQRSPAPNNSVMETQPRNHSLNFDSLLTGPPVVNIRANQATSAGDSGIPERSQSNAGSLDGTETQQGHNVGQGLNHGKNDTEGGENMEAWVNYDFLGSQIHLKSQPQAGVQYRRARNKTGLDEMQSRKQQYSYQHQELRRQQQTQQLEQDAQQQQTQQLMQQAQQQFQLKQPARQQRAQQLEQQMRQEQVQQLMPHAQQQQSQQLKLHVRQQRALQQQAQQLDQHTQQQQAQQLDQNARQQQARWQKQIYQVLAGDNQSMGNQFAPSLYSSSMHDASTFVHSSSLTSHMGIESHTPTIVTGNPHCFKVGNVNRMPNGSPSLSGFPPEALLSQDTNLVFQASALMGSPMDPSSQGAVQQLADAPHNLASAANHLVGKPVAHILGVVASVPGDHRTTSFDPTSIKIEGKEGILNKSSFRQTFPQNQGVSNLLQGTPMSRSSQLQDFNSKKRSWNEDLGQKYSFQGVSSQALGDSDAPLDSGLNNFQPGRCPSLTATQVVPYSDDRNQSTSTGQFVLQGAYQTEKTEFLSSLAANQQGGWSAFMQSVVAESHSGLNLQKTETTSSDNLHFHPNIKEQNIWNEQNAQVNNSMNGRSFSLFNDDSVQSVQALPQSSSEGRGHLGSKMESIQRSNQIELQSGPSSKLVQEAAGHASTWQDQNLYQHIEKSSNLHSSFESRQGNSWITHNREQVPSEGRLPSHHINNDGSQQNNSLQNLTSKDQSVWNKNEAQETAQNNLFLNANKGYQENENENTEREQLGSCTEKTEGQMYQIRHEGNKGTGASFQSQDPKLNAYQNEQPLQQEEFSRGIFSKHVIEDNSENSARRSQLDPAKPKSAKKAKTIPRVIAESSNNEYAEAVVPPKDKSIEEVQVSNYASSRIAQSSEQVELVDTCVDKEAIQNAEKIGAQGRAVSAWIKRLLAQGTQLIESSIELYNNLGEVKAELNETFDTLSQDLQLIEQDIRTWSRLQDVKLEMLVEHNMIPNRKKFVIYMAAMKNKKGVIKGLIEDLKEALHVGKDKGLDISDKIAELPCQMLDDSQKTLPMDAVVQEFTTLVHTEIETKAFTLASIDKLVDFKATLDNLQTILARHKSRHVTIADSITRVQTIFTCTQGANHNEVQAALKRYDDNLKKCKEEEIHVSSDT